MSFGLRFGLIFGFFVVSVYPLFFPVVSHAREARDPGDQRRPTHSHQKSFDYLSEVEEAAQITNDQKKERLRALTSCSLPPRPLFSKKSVEINRGRSMTEPHTRPSLIQIEPTLVFDSSPDFFRGLDDSRRSHKLQALKFLDNQKLNSHLRAHTDLLFNFGETKVESLHALNEIITSEIDYLEHLKKLGELLDLQKQSMAWDKTGRFDLHGRRINTKVHRLLQLLKRSRVTQLEQKSLLFLDALRLACFSDSEDRAIATVAGVFSNQFRSIFASLRTYSAFYLPMSQLAGEIDAAVAALSPKHSEPPSFKEGTASLAAHLLLPEAQRVPEIVNELGRLGLLDRSKTSPLAPLKEVLITPVQRMMRYSILLKAVKTAVDHQVKEDSKLLPDGSPALTLKQTNSVLLGSLIDELDRATAEVNSTFQEEGQD